MNSLKQHIITLIITAASLIIFSTTAFAAPSLESTKEFKQPNGMSFLATQYGDEFLNYYATENGDIIEQKSDGFWYYATTQNFISAGKDATKLIPTSNKYLIDKSPSNAVQQADLTEHPALHYKEDSAKNVSANIFNTPQSLAPTLSKDQTILTILVSFNDIAPKQSDSAWYNQIFGTSNKSVKNYYNESTGGKINIVPAKENSGTVNDGIVRVKLNRNHPQTAGNTSVINQQLVRDALIAADGFVNFAQYDRNGNNIIEADELHIMTIIAGQEAAYSSSSGGVWGHQWSLGTNTPALDGKRFNTYTQFGEMHGDHQATIGIICHELGHDLGLPDLYNTLSGGSGSGLGGYSVMSQGNWGKLSSDRYQGQTPVHFDAYSKMKLGVTNPTIAPTTTTYTKDIFSFNHALYNTLRFNTANPKEYFLVENRQFAGYDTALSTYTFAGGLAIYHINENYTNNQTVGKQLVTLKEANQGKIGYSKLNNKEIYSSDGLFYAGTGIQKTAQATTFNKYTNPSNILSDNTFAPFSLKVNSNSSAQMNLTIGPESFIKRTLGSLDSYTITRSNINISGWHADTAVTKNLSSYIFLIDANSGKEISRHKITRSTRLDVARAYPDVINSQTSGFSLSIPISSDLRGKNIKIMSRYASLTDGNGSVSDYYFPTAKVIPAAQTAGSLDSLNITNSTITMRGWHLSDDSLGNPNSFIFIMDAATGREIARYPINRSSRADVAKAYPTYVNGQASGFNLSVPIPSAARGKNITIMSRYAKSINGNGTVSDIYFSTSKSVPVARTIGALDAFNVTSTTITASGWQVSDEAVNYPYSFIFIMDASTGREISRYRITRTTRADVARMHTTYANAQLSGFSISVPIPAAAKKKNITIMSRYSKNADGNGTYSDVYFAPIKYVP